MSIATRPMRYPNMSSQHVMVRRGWWLVIFNVLIPGSVQILAGNRKLGRFGLSMTLLLWVLGVTAVVIYLMWPTVLYTIASSPLILWATAALLIFYALLWVILTIDALRLVRLIKMTPSARVGVPIFSIVLLIVFSGTAAYGAFLATSASNFVSSVFIAGPSQKPIDGKYNILLLGGDAGADRDGLRPDSISVVSIDATTGAATMIGLPRDLEDVPFPKNSPLHAAYPEGFGAVDGCEVSACMLNSIYTEVELKSPDMYPDAVHQGSTPGLEGMRDAAEGILGIPIQYYVLIDMQGFSGLIDALGGVIVNVEKRIPMGAGHDEDNEPVEITEWIEPGEQKLDGFHALWYARSRFESSDYDRMMRQRQLQEAFLAQFTPANVVAKFQGVAEAGAQVVKTDIPQSMLGYFIELGMKTKELPIVHIEMVPPEVDPQDPDYEHIHNLVHDALWPPIESPVQIE
jgi:LCP family protein required for cell wall assembly